MPPNDVDGAAPRSLRTDQRGAILITAVVMGAVLVVAVLYVLQVGEAIFVHERLQDAADASAFEAAVWHARGMNMTAVLNILMSLALAVIATMRQVELVCLVIPGAEGCATTMVDWERTATPWVRTSLKILENIEVSVAVVTPLVATATSTGVPAQFEEDGDPDMRGAAFSLALLPVGLDRTLQFAPDRNPGPGRFERDRIGTDFPVRLPDSLSGGLGTAANAMPSLPVQKGDFSDLCAKASTFIVRQIDSIIDYFGERYTFIRIIDRLSGNWITRGIVNHALDWAGRHLSSLMCTPVQDLADQTIQDIAEQTCEGFETQREADIDEAEDWNLTHPRDQHNVPDGWSTRDQESCMDREEGDAATAQGSDFDSAPAVLYELAENGSPFLHTWSVMQEIIPDEEQDPNHPIEPRMAVAEAEYYFNCDDQPSDCRGEALWRPNWTARMRRFRMPWDELDWAGFALTQITGGFEAHLGEIISAHLEAAIEHVLADAACSGVNPAISGPCQGLAERFNPLTNWIEGKAQQLIEGTFDRAGDSSVFHTVGEVTQDYAGLILDKLIDAALIEQFEDFVHEELGVGDTRHYHRDARIH